MAQLTSTLIGGEDVCLMAHQRAGGPGRAGQADSLGQGGHRGPAVGSPVGLAEVSGWTGGGQLELPLGSSGPGDRESASAAL